MVSALDHASDMTADQVRDLVAAAMAFAATFWQISHPTPTLAKLCEQVPAWGHVALDFAPRFRRLLEATAVGLAQTPSPAAAAAAGPAAVGQPAGAGPKITLAKSRSSSR